ncbi:MAG: hypothetical protein ACK558_13705 [Pseudomonadota bacterium]
MALAPGLQVKLVPVATLVAPAAGVVSAGAATGPPDTSICSVPPRTMAGVLPSAPCTETV